MNKLLIAIVSIILSLVLVTIVVGSLTFEGTVVKDPYTTALHWDASHHDRTVSGWRVALKTPQVKAPSSELIVSIADKNGNVMKDAAVELFLTRPSTDRYDVNYKMEQDAAGYYKAIVQVPVKGRWLARLNVTVEEMTITFNETIYAD